MSGRQENAKINEGTGDQEFTTGNRSSKLAANESLVNVKNLEVCLNERIGKETVKNVDAVENRIHHANLTAIDGDNTPKIE